MDAFILGGVYRQQNGWLVRLQALPFRSDSSSTYPVPEAREGQAYAVQLRESDHEPIEGDGIRDLATGRYPGAKDNANYGSHLLPELLGFYKEFSHRNRPGELTDAPAATAAARVNEQEPKRPPLDWAKPAIWEPFPGFATESDPGDTEDGTWHATKSGALGRSTGADDFGRTTFVNPLLRG